MNQDLMDKLVAARLLLNFSDINSIIYFSEVAKAIFNEAYAIQFSNMSASMKAGTVKERVNSFGEKIKGFDPSQIKGTDGKSLQNNRTGTRQPKVLGSSNKKPVMGRKIA